MAERLTDKINHEAINRCGEYSSCYSCKREVCYITELCNKLGELEDILEKYGVDIQNLDYILEDYSENQGRDFAICEEMDDLKKDRDTWKSACELACDVLRDINYKIYNEDRIDFENTFYQQAKNKEKEDEKV